MVHATLLSHSLRLSICPICLTSLLVNPVARLLQPVLNVPCHARRPLPFLGHKRRKALDRKRKNEALKVNGWVGRRAGGLVRMCMLHAPVHMSATHQCVHFNATAESQAVALSPVARAASSELFGDDDNDFGLPPLQPQTSLRVSTYLPV